MPLGNINLNHWLLVKLQSQDLLIMSEYFKKWGLQPYPGKTEVTVFHLNNKEANQQLHI